MLFYRKNSLPYGMRKWRWFTYANYNDSGTGHLAILFPAVSRRYHVVIGRHYEGRQLYIAVQMTAVFGFELALWLSGRIWQINTHNSNWHYEIRIGPFEVTINNRP